MIVIVANDSVHFDFMDTITFVCNESIAVWYMHSPNVRNPMLIVCYNTVISSLRMLWFLEVSTTANITVLTSETRDCAFDGRVVIFHGDPFASRIIIIMMNSDGRQRASAHDGAVSAPCHLRRIVTGIHCHILATHCGFNVYILGVTYGIIVETRGVGNAIFLLMGINEVEFFEESTAQVPRLVPRLIRS